jgi:hypothetical protein
MATESVSNLSELLKEVWTQDRLEKQFYSGTRWLDKVEKTNKYTIGRQAQVPLELSLPGGTTTTLAAGSSALNAADDLTVDRADYLLSYVWQQVAVETAAFNQADSVGMRSTVDAADQTIESNVLALRKEVNRQAVSNGDALIALTTGTATSAEIELDPTGYGYDAIVRGWLRPGMTVDIGTTASETSVTADKLITAVEEAAATPSVTIESSVTLSGTTYVSIANNRSGTTSREMSGLRTIVGSATSTIGTLAPASVSQWKPATVDTSTTLVSLDLLVTLRNAVYQKTGLEPGYVTTSVKQSGELYKLFQSQVRFQGDNTSAGNVSSFTWNGMSVNPDPDIPDRELYLLNLKDFFVVTGGKFGKPTWVSDIEGGAGGRFRWAQGSTKFVDAVTYPLQVAIKRRNSNAAAIGLTG